MTKKELIAYILLSPIIIPGRLVFKIKYWLLTKEPAPMVIDTFTDSEHEVKPGKWAIAKPKNFSKRHSPLKMRFKHAYYVLTTKATAVRFAEDVINDEETN